MLFYTVLAVINRIMKIETKFNIGDTCFYLDCNKVIKDNISGIHVKIRENFVKIICVVNKASDMDEKIIHKTKEELLNSL